VVVVVGNAAALVVLLQLMRQLQRLRQGGVFGGMHSSIDALDGGGLVVGMHGGAGVHGDDGDVLHSCSLHMF